MLFPEFSNLCLANAIEPLRAANEFLGAKVYSWDYATISGDAVPSSSGLSVLPQGRLGQHPGGDYLFILASYNMRAQSTPETRAALRSASSRFSTLVGMDTAPWLLAHAGLIGQQPVTIHPQEQVAFSEEFSEIDVVTDRYVLDASPMSCGGAATAFEFVLELLRRSHGDGLALDVSTLFLEFDAAPKPLLLKPPAASGQLKSLIALMGENVERPLPIAELARAANTSQRSLARAFQKEFGATPQQVYRRIRLSAARDLVRQSRHSIAEIALRCGYRDASAMTRAFREEFGVTPTEVRVEAAR